MAVGKKNDLVEGCLYEEGFAQTDFLSFFYWRTAQQMWMGRLKKSPEISFYYSKNTTETYKHKNIFWKTVLMNASLMVGGIVVIVEGGFFQMDQKNPQKQTQNSYKSGRFLYLI